MQSARRTQIASTPAVGQYNGARVHQFFPGRMQPPVPQNNVEGNKNPPELLCCPTIEVGRAAVVLAFSIVHFVTKRL